MVSFTLLPELYRSLVCCFWVTFTSQAMFSAFRGRNNLLRVVALAAAGSGVLYANTDPKFQTRSSFSVQLPLSERLLFSLPTFPSSDHCFNGLYPSFSFSTSFSPSDNAGSAKSANTAGSDKPCSGGCFGRDTIANAAARVGPAVVNLSAPQGFYGMPMGKNIGSGTIIDQDGTILTCAHVVIDFQGLRSPSKGKVAVTLQDGRIFEGTVTNLDIHSDIAIVKINSKTPLPTATLGSSNKLRPGDWVLAIGCPLSLQNTVTAGIVSCVDRKSSDLGLEGIRREYLQTDCAINSGNSGGPLVNIDGEVVGVNTMKVLGADGLSFSVPMNSVSKIIAQFRKSGRVIRPWLGLRLLDLNDMIVEQLKERDPKFPNVSKGILVSTVTPGSPADRAGISPGDVIVEFDGKPVESISEIIEIIGDRIGVPMKVVIKRAKDRMVTFSVTPVESRPNL